MTAWRLPYDYVPGDCLRTAWGLPDNCLTFEGSLIDFRLNHSSTTKTTTAREKHMMLLKAVCSLKKKNIHLIKGHCDRIQSQKDLIFFWQILTRSATVWSLKPCRRVIHKWLHHPLRGIKRGKKRSKKESKRESKMLTQGREGVKKYEKNDYRISFSRTILQIILAILIILCINFMLFLINTRIWRPRIIIIPADLIRRKTVYMDAPEWTYLLKLVLGGMANFSALVVMFCYAQSIPFCRSKLPRRTIKKKKKWEAAVFSK